MEVSNKQAWDVTIEVVDVVVIATTRGDGQLVLRLMIRDERRDVVRALLLPVQSMKLVEDVLRLGLPATGMTPHDALGWVLALEEAAERIRDAYALLRATERPASAGADDGPKPQDE